MQTTITADQIIAALAELAAERRAEQTRLAAAARPWKPRRFPS